jgi:hypothetical protein
MNFKKTFGFPTDPPPCSGTAEGLFFLVWRKWFYEKYYNF